MTRSDFVASHIYIRFFSFLIIHLLLFKDCSSNSRKLKPENVSKFHNVLSWLQRFNIFMNAVSLPKSASGSFQCKTRQNIQYEEHFNNIPHAGVLVKRQSGKIVKNSLTHSVLISRTFRSCVEWTLIEYIKKCQMTHPSFCCQYAVGLPKYCEAKHGHLPCASFR